MSEEINRQTARQLARQIFESLNDHSEVEMQRKLFMALQIAEKRGQVLANYRHDNPKHSHHLTTLKGAL